MQFSATFVALVMAATSVSGHVFLVSPKPFTPADPANPSGPLKDSGSDYPCSTSFTGATAVTIAKGSQNQISLQGSAVHGGGSCQISITYDAKPSKSSKFTVIKSFQGGCPIANTPGNLPDNPSNALPGLPYTIPDDAPAGSAIIAWTWFNKIGNREMYMRCAPITITGSAGNKSKFSGRPEILKANIGNGCSTKEGTEINFPAPGDAVVGKGNGSPVGNCGPTAAGGSGGDSDTSTPTTPTTTPKDGGDSTTTPVKNTPVKTTPDTPVKSAPASSSGGSCTGSIVCLSSTQWAMCSNGKKYDMGSVAGGTVCKNNALVPIARRRVRRTDFSRK